METNQNDQAIIERIKYLMDELRYKQVEFAQKIDINASNLSKYLNGRLPVSQALINRIVVNLGVSKQWLEQGTDLPFAKQVSTPTLAVPRLMRQPMAATSSVISGHSMLKKQ